MIEELVIGIMPILLGQGLKLFDHPSDKEIALEKIRVLESVSGRTDIIFKVLKG